MTERSECDLMKQFVDDNYAFQYILWLETILPMQEKPTTIDIEEEND